VADTLYADVSEWQVGVNDSYPYPVLCIRSNDGTHRDRRWVNNYGWCLRNAEGGRLVLELGRQIANALEDKPCRVYVAPFDVRLPKATEDDDQVDTVVQPDVLIVSDLKKLDARGVRGAPDWVAEVLLPSTARHDRTLKLSAYERAGVREVWLIDPVDRTLTIYRLEAGYYGRPTTLELKGRTQLTAVPGVTVDWARVLAKMS